MTKVASVLTHPVVCRSAAGARVGGGGQGDCVGDTEPLPQATAGDDAP